MNRLAIALLALPALASPACGDYLRLESLSVQLAINRNGSLEVTERMAPPSTGYLVEETITREITTRRRTGLFTYRTTPFEFISKSPPGFRPRRRFYAFPGGRRIILGEKGRRLPENPEPQFLAYRLLRAVEFGADHDGVSLDVTAGCRFHIDTVTVAVKPPEGLPEELLDLSVFVGRPGAQSRNFVFGRDARGRITVTVKDRIRPNETLAVNLTWPKGFVDEPSTPEKFGLFVADNKSLVVAAVGVPLVLAYYVLAWMVFGRDPRRGTVIPLFHPPKGVSPAAARYLLRQSCDQKTLATAVVSLVAQGRITIHKEDGFFQIETTPLARTDNSLSFARMKPGVPPEEREVLTSLFGSIGTFRFEPSNGAAVWHTVNALERVLKRVVRRGSFRVNRPAFLVGLVLSLLTLFIAGTSAGVRAGVSRGADTGPDFVVLGAMLVACSAALVVVAVYALSRWRNVLHGARGPSAVRSLVAWNALLALMAAFVVFWMYKAVSVSSAVLVPAFAALAVINLVFYRLLTTYTQKGRWLVEQLEGFRMYLGAAERDNIAQASPEKTPMLFERYLPYAMAMDVESKWAAQFNEVVLGTDAYYAAGGLTGGW